MILYKRPIDLEREIGYFGTTTSCSPFCCCLNLATFTSYLCSLIAFVAFLVKFNFVVGIHALYSNCSFPDYYQLCGRYHISGTKGVFYAREPYANIDAVHVTRFIGLAPVGNTDKQVFTFSQEYTSTSSMQLYIFPLWNLS